MSSKKVTGTVSYILTIPPIAIERLCTKFSLQVYNQANLHRQTAAYSAVGHYVFFAWTPSKQNTWRWSMGKFRCIKIALMQEMSVSAVVSGALYNPTKTPATDKWQKPFSLSMQQKRQKQSKNSFYPTHGAASATSVKCFCPKSTWFQINVVFSW